MGHDSGNCGCKDYSLLKANLGIATLLNGNSALDGTGAVTVLRSGTAKGTIVKSVRIKAAGTNGQVTKGMIRLFISDGTDAYLYKEVNIPITPYTANTPTPLVVLETFQMVLDCDLRLPNGYALMATTQNSETFNIC